jgi:hypothetical protein
MNCTVGDRKGRGMIQKSDSTWMSPAVLVQKDGGLQVCVEYQRLNDNSEDCFVLLQIDDTLDTLIGVKWFSTFDLKNGYWQVLLQPDGDLHRGCAVAVHSNALQPWQCSSNI